MVNKRVWNAVHGCNLKNNRMISVHFQGKPLNITIIWVHAPTSNTEETEVEPFYEGLKDLLELTPPKICPFHYRGLECKSRKSRNTWSNRQIWPWSTEWSRAKANRVLPRGCTGHSKHPLPTTQEKTLHMDITRWSIPKSDWLYSLQPKMEKLYTVSKSRLGSDYGSDTPYCSWTPYCQIQTEIEESRENHLEKAMAPHSSTLAWKIPRVEETGRPQSMGLQRVGNDWAASLSLFTFMHWRRKWQPTPAFLPGESQGQGSLVGCRLWSHTQSDTTEVT